MHPSDPQSPDSQLVSREARAAQVRHAFQCQWRAGEQPRIEDYLGQAAPGEREHLLRELTLEWSLRAVVGQRSELDEYRQRFLQDAALVESAWAAFDERRRDPTEASTRDLAPCHETPDGVQTLDSEGHTVPETPAALGETEIPKQIGRYAILRQLGRGGFGVVYLAHDPELDRNVAIKTPRADKFESEAELHEFVREAKTAAKLDHPGLVRVYDVQHDDVSTYIV